VLIADNENDLQYMISRLEVFCQQSQMQVNIAKTKWMIFEMKACQSTGNLSISFAHQLLERVHRYKYLGIFFSSKMNFSDHVNFMLIKAEKAAHLFWKYVERFGPTLLVNLSETLVLSIIIYGAEIWYPMHMVEQYDRKRIETFYICNLKRILGVPLSTANPAVYIELNQLDIESKMETKILEFFVRLNQIKTCCKTL
jgi:hypothetical protein